MSRLSDERLREMIGAGVPCVPANPGETAALVSEVIEAREVALEIIEIDQQTQQMLVDFDPAGSTYRTIKHDGPCARLARSFLNKETDND